MHRCPWSGSDPLMIEYHDTEWGVPLHDDQKLFEFLILEGAQAGLSWRTVLYKRENYRKAFDHFDVNKVARYTDRQIARLMNDAGVITIAAFVAPHEAVREKVKQVIGRDRVLEVFCTAPMEVLRARDQSGAYRLADEGKIAQMPGVTAAFEEPKSPDLVLQTDQISVEESVHRIVELMRVRGYLREPPSRR